MIRYERVGDARRRQRIARSKDLERDDCGAAARELSFRRY
jgi:hypothetical protein